MWYWRDNIPLGKEGFLHTLFTSESLFSRSPRKSTFYPLGDGVLPGLTANQTEHRSKLRDSVIPGASRDPASQLWHVITLHVPPGLACHETGTQASQKAFKVDAITVPILQIRKQESEVTARESKWKRTPQAVHANLKPIFNTTTIMLF